jgi:ribose 5-phosphate isomerase B
VAAIAVAADDAGAPLKERLAYYLHQKGHEVEDFGNGTDQDYPDVAAKVAEAVARGEHDRARKSNDAQVLTMGARVIASEAAEMVLEHWLASEFEGGRSAPKVDKMNQVDARYRTQQTASG